MTKGYIKWKPNDQRGALRRFPARFSLWMSSSVNAKINLPLTSCSSCSNMPISWKWLSVDLNHQRRSVMQIQYSFLSNIKIVKKMRWKFDCAHSKTRFERLVGNWKRPQCYSFITMSSFLLMLTTKGNSLIKMFSQFKAKNASLMHSNIQVARKKGIQLAFFKYILPIAPAHYFMILEALKSCIK